MTFDFLVGQFEKYETSYEMISDSEQEWTHTSYAEEDKIRVAGTPAQDG